mgnify:CR=1 FL=1
MAGGVAVINVGAATETEMKEKKARVEDALAATRAAVEEGIVPGGGVTLLRAAKALDKLDLQGEELVGMHIVRRALEEPSRQIATNAGQEGSVLVRDALGKSGNDGYNAATDTFEVMGRTVRIEASTITASSLQTLTDDRRLHKKRLEFFSA